MNVDIPLALPMIDQDEKDAVLAVLESNWLTHGPNNIEFESRFAEYLGVKHAIAMNSCTSALEIALKANQIKGEVVVPSFTFVASANAIVTSGATPIFCDVDFETRNTNLEKIKACITQRTEAVMVVHFGGQTCKGMNQIKAYCEKKGLLLIEDSAENIGGTWKQKQAGSFGVGCFSFFPTKNLTTGEGGMMTCDDDTMAERARALIGHGISSSTFSREKKDKPWFRAAVIPGHNYRMSNILAAIGVHQIKKLDRMNRTRREIAETFSREILERRIPARIPETLKGAEHVFQMYTVTVDPLKRDEWVKTLRDEGVGASVHFDPPVHEMAFYAENYPPPYPMPNTEKLSRSLITLPIFPTMTDNQVERVLAAMQKVMK